MVDSDAVLFEIWDTCPKVLVISTFFYILLNYFIHLFQETGFDLSIVNQEAIQWSDGILLCYSITDRNSFNFIRKFKDSLQPDIPVLLVGNKVDMVHLRQVCVLEIVL